MISYHHRTTYDGSAYGYGFKTADTNDVERIAHFASGSTWSPIIWRKGERGQVNFERADWCVLDFDNKPSDGFMSLEEAKRTFCDMVHFIGTTRSHQKEKHGRTVDRFRVAMMFTNPILNVRDYRYTMERVTKRYPVDDSGKDGARYFFQCQEIVQINADGYTEDPMIAGDDFERPNTERYTAYASAGVLPTKVRAALIMEIPKGRRNTTWYGISKDLARMGFAFEKIVAQIMRSPTCTKHENGDLLAEVEQCVRSGINAVDRELTNGRVEGRDAQ